MERESMVFYQSWDDAMNEYLPTHEQLIFLKSIIKYGLHGEKTKTGNDKIDMFLSNVYSQIDVNNKKYIGGCKGGRKKKSPEKSAKNAEKKETKNNGKTIGKTIGLNNDNVNVNENEHLHYTDNTELHTASFIDASLEAGIMPDDNYGEWVDLSQMTDDEFAKYKEGQKHEHL